MTAPRTHPRTRGQQLAAEAAEAAEVRDAMTHPDVVALRVEKTRRVVEWFIWAGMILGLLFTMTNVQQFTAHTTGAPDGSLGWWAAWLLDPTVSLVLLGILLAERQTSRWQIKQMGEWSRAAKWSLLAATYVMNTWESWADRSLAGIVLHSVPPLVVFMAAEAVTELQDKLTECVHRAHAHATARAERKAHADREKRDKQAAETAAEQARITAPVVPAGQVVPAPVPPPAPAPFQAVPNRPGPVLATRSADRPGPAPAVRSADRPDPAPRIGPPERTAERSADRPGTPARTAPARRRTGKPRTDAQLSRAVRELADRNGGTPPSQYQVKQRLGVGSGRAARLLADLATTPAGPPAHNGAATRKDGAQ